MVITRVLRNAIINCPESLYTIAKKSGVPGPVVSRFARGKQSLNLVSADKLADYFQLQLTKKDR